MLGMKPRRNTNPGMTQREPRFRDEEKRDARRPDESKLRWSCPKARRVETRNARVEKGREVKGESRRTDRH